MMKQFKNMILLGVLLLATSAVTQAQLSKSRQVDRTFKVSKGTQIDIINKYGNIQVETWDNDSIQLHIDLEVTEKNRAKLHKKFNQVDFELTQTSQYLIIETKLGGSESDVDRFFNQFKENFGIGDASIQIDYLVKVPENMVLNIQNKFGNIYLGDYNGEISFDLSGGGKIKARNLTGHVKLKVNTGDVDIDYVESGHFEVNYGEMNINQAKKLTINSRNSDIVIREVIELVANSTIDEYRIKSVEQFETEANYSEFVLSKLILETEAKLNASDLEIDEIDPDFAKIYIDGKSSKINLEFTEDTDIRFDILSIKPTIELPENTVLTVQDEVDAKNLKFQYKGYHGSNQEGDPNIILRTKSGKINIYKK